MALRPDVLARASANAHGLVAATPLGHGHAVPSLARACEPEPLRTALLAVGERLGCDDLAVVGSVVGRDVLAAVTGLAVGAWVTDRVALDVSSANLAVDLRGDRPRLALARADTVEGPSSLGQLGTWLFDDAVPCVVDGLRAITRVGARHLWGTVALGVVNTVAALGHRRPAGAVADLAQLLARRPDLTGLVELVERHDDHGDPLTYAIRRTCCLLVKVPGGGCCGTCSLRPRDERIAACDAHFLGRRRALRAASDPTATHRPAGDT